MGRGDSGVLSPRPVTHVARPASPPSPLTYRTPNMRFQASYKFIANLTKLSLVNHLQAASFTFV
jgi:hypothetical protein